MYMRIFDFKKIEWDKTFIILSLLTVLLSIICGIVLYKLVYFDIYLSNYVSDYIYYVYNFKNTRLFFARFISELFYFYVLFLIAYFTKLKYLSLLLFFIKSFFAAIYCILLCSVGGISGLLAAILIFIPTTVIALCFYILLIEACRLIYKKYVFFIPLIFALSVSVIMMVLVNVLFRIIIIIV
jgi:hypothetical protein